MWLRVTRIPRKLICLSKLKAKSYGHYPSNLAADKVWAWALVTMDTYVGLVRGRYVASKLRLQLHTDLLFYGRFLRENQQRLENKKFPWHHGQENQKKAEHSRRSLSHDGAFWSRCRWGCRRGVSTKVLHVTTICGTAAGGTGGHPNARNVCNPGFCLSTETYFVHGAVDQGAIRARILKSNFDSIFC